MNMVSKLTLVFWFVHFLLIGVTVTGEVDVLNSVAINDRATEVLVSETPTLNPSRIPSRAPSRVPTPKTPHIYGDAQPVYISKVNQQIMCGILTILLFVFMALEVLSPEVLFLIALVILLLTQVLTLTETLSGNKL